MSSSCDEERSYGVADVDGVSALNAETKGKRFLGDGGRKRDGSSKEVSSGVGARPRWRKR